ARLRAALEVGQTAVHHQPHLLRRVLQGRAGHAQVAQGAPDKAELPLVQHLERGALLLRPRRERGLGVTPFVNEPLSQWGVSVRSTVNWARAPTEPEAHERQRFP